MEVHRGMEEEWWQRRRRREVSAVRERKGQILGQCVYGCCLILIGLPSHFFLFFSWGPSFNYCYVFILFYFLKSVIWKIFFPLVTLGWSFGWFNNAINYVTSDKRNCFPFSLGTKYKIEDRIEFVPKMHPSHITYQTCSYVLTFWLARNKNLYTLGLIIFQFYKKI